MKHTPRGSAALYFEGNMLVIESGSPMTRRSDKVLLCKGKFSRRILRHDVDAPVALDLLPVVFEDLGDFVDDTSAGFASFTFRIPLIRFITTEEKWRIAMRIKDTFRHHHIKLNMSDRAQPVSSAAR